MKVVIKIVIPLVILGLAYLGYKYMEGKKPAPENRQPPVPVPLVDVLEVSAESHAPPMMSYGTVGSYLETVLSAQVAGEIVEVSSKFRVGEMVEEGHVLVRIDDKDYVASLEQERANLTAAERVYEEEKIRAEQAAGDWVASGRDLAKASDFVLRKPQLAAAAASVESAKAAVEKAEADVERTEIKSPYAAVVAARDAAPGMQANQQVALGRLVFLEKVEVRLPLTAGQLARVKLPVDAELMSPLKPGVKWDAKLVRMEPVVDQQNQVMYAVAEVEKPYSRKGEELAVGLLVNAKIGGLAMEDTYKVPGAALVDDRFLWVVGEEEKLARVEMERVYEFEGFVFLKRKTVEAGVLMVVTRPLSNFRGGMQVRENKPKAVEE